MCPNMTLAQRLEKVIGLQPNQSTESDKKPNELELPENGRETIIKVTSDNSALVSITYPHESVAEQIAPFRITKEFTHHGVSSFDDRLATFATTGAFALLFNLLQGDKLEKMFDIKISRRDFLKLAFVGSALITFGSKLNILGMIARQGASLKGYDDLKALMAHFDPLRSFIGGVLQPQERQETHSYSSESISVDFAQQKNIHSEANYALNRMPITWQQENKETATDDLYIYEPDQSTHFMLKMHSALAHMHEGKDAIGYQVGVMLHKLLGTDSNQKKYWSHNRYNDPHLLFESTSPDDVMTDPNGINRPVNYMHTGPLFLAFYPQNDGKPLFATVPSWTAQPSMGWGGTVTTETSLNLIEFICFANEYASWSTDMMEKYDDLSQSDKERFFQLFTSKLVDHWGGVPIENYSDLAYHTVLVLNDDGRTVQEDKTLVKQLEELKNNGGLRSFLSNNHILKPVSLVNLDRSDQILPRESIAKNISINFSIIKDNKCIAHITANQNRRVNMEQLKKIAILYLENKGHDTKNAYLVGMDEHGGGEVVNVTDI